MMQEGTHKISLDRLLECGVILNWKALMQTATSSIQVDYRLASVDLVRAGVLEGVDQHN